jgi:hypothetical protein
MGENQTGLNGNLENLAEIAEKVQNLYDGKTTVVFELKKEEYSKTISLFREIDRNHKQFKIDISGTEFIFLLIEENV